MNVTKIILRITRYSALSKTDKDKQLFSLVCYFWKLASIPLEINTVWKMSMILSLRVNTDVEIISLAI